MMIIYLSGIHKINWSQITNLQIEKRSHKSQILETYINPKWNNYIIYEYIILHRSSDLGTIDRRTSSILQIMIPTNLLGSCLLQFSRKAAVMWNSPCSTRRSIRNQRRAETTLFLIIVWEVFKVFSPTTLLLSARVCCCCFFRRNSSDHRRWTTAKLVHHINLTIKKKKKKK